MSSTSLYVTCICLHLNIYFVNSFFKVILQKENFVICRAGMRKAYWITCNVEPDIQHLSLDRRKFPSSCVVRPRDFNRLLSNFQSSLQEITVIATEPVPITSASGTMIGGKAVELRSYIDPTKGTQIFMLSLPIFNGFLYEAYSKLESQITVMQPYTPNYG